MQDFLGCYTATKFLAEPPVPFFLVLPGRCSSRFFHNVGIQLLCYMTYCRWQESLCTLLCETKVSRLCRKILSDVSRQVDSWLIWAVHIMLAGSLPITLYFKKSSHFPWTGLHLLLFLVDLLSVHVFLFIYLLWKQRRDIRQLRFYEDI